MGVPQGHCHRGATLQDSPMKRTLLTLLVLIVGLSGQALAEEMSSIISSDAKVEKLGGGMRFTEGPVWIPSRKMVGFSERGPMAKRCKF